MKILVLMICSLAVFLFAINCETDSPSISQKTDTVKTELDVNLLTKKPVAQNNNIAQKILLSHDSLQPQLLEAVSKKSEISESPKYGIQMLMNTEYYEEEVENKIGSHKGWIGLYRKKNKYYLLPATLKVKVVRHFLRDDENAKEKTGRKVSSNINLPSVFLLKNAKMLRQGEVKTIFYGNEQDSESINRKYRREFDFNGKKYTLFVEDPNEEGGEFLTDKSKMVIFQGTRKQIIYKPEFCSDCSWDLCWVGDLDKDGKLDFMLNLSPHYNSTCHTLFLSSQAKKGEVVRDIAEMCQQGC